MRSWLFKRLLNVWPCFRGSGGRVTYISGDWREARVEVPFNLRTRNYVGTIYGGSMYGAVDPIYMLMLIKVLGKDYVVWDKAASIRFRRPGRDTLEARFVLGDEELASIREATSDGKPLDRVYLVELKDREGNVCAAIEKTLYIRRKDAPKSVSASSR